MATPNSPNVPPQSVPPLDDRGGDPTLPPLLVRAWWLFFNSVADTLRSLREDLSAFEALDFVFGGSKLTVGVMPKAAKLKALTDSSISDDGARVTIAEPVLIDAGAAPDESQLQLSADGLGALQALCYGAGNVQVLFDCAWTGAAMVAAHTGCARIITDSTTWNLYGAVGQVVGDPLVDAALLAVDLATGNTTIAGVYKVAGVQVVGPRGAGLTAAAGYGGGTAGGAYNARVQLLLNQAIVQILNLKTRLDQVEARLQAHGLIA